MPDYNLLGSTEVLEELQEGRTRELLMLLQDKPVPEVQDPMDLQTGLSDKFKQTNGDYVIPDTLSSTLTFAKDETATFGRTQAGLIFNPNTELDELDFTVSSEMGSSVTNINVSERSSGTVIDDIGTVSPGNSATATGPFNEGVDYLLLGDNSEYWRSKDYKNSQYVDVPDGYANESSGSIHFFTTITGRKNNIINAEITDRFPSPTTEPADFAQWNAIQARDVTTGGSTSPEPVEFEILDSTDTVLNSTRIPKARIADEPFTMRNRVYSKSAGSNGQSDYTIATTGDGGHFGIPVLTVVSVKKNGSVLDSANWSFDPDTDTVTINTSNVTIASGDTIDIKYDFDVFDSTLQPRAYLSRESTSETSPSISHFRYEYVI